MNSPAVRSGRTGTGRPPADLTTRFDIMKARRDEITLEFLDAHVL